VVRQTGLLDPEGTRIMEHESTQVSNLRARDDLIQGWWVWMSPKSRTWHARKQGTDKPVLVHGNTLEDLSEMVKQSP
jgi:hypothetical protein